MEQVRPQSLGGLEIDRSYDIHANRDDPPQHPIQASHQDSSLNLTSPVDSQYQQPLGQPNHNTFSSAQYDGQSGLTHQPHPGDIKNAPDVSYLPSDDSASRHTSPSTTKNDLSSCIEDLIALQQSMYSLEHSTTISTHSFAQQLARLNAKTAEFTKQLELVRRENKHLEHQNQLLREEKAEYMNYIESSKIMPVSSDEQQLMAMQAASPVDRLPADDNDIVHQLQTRLHESEQHIVAQQEHIERLTTASNEYVELYNAIYVDHQRLSDENEQLQQKIASLEPVSSGEQDPSPPPSPSPSPLPSLSLKDVQTQHEMATQQLEEKLEATIASYENKLIELEDASSEAIITLHEQLEEQTQQVTALTNEVVALKQENASLQQQVRLDQSHDETSHSDTPHTGPSPATDPLVDAQPAPQEPSHLDAYWDGLDDEPFILEDISAEQAEVLTISLGQGDSYTIPVSSQDVHKPAAEQQDDHAHLSELQQRIHDLESQLHENATKLAASLETNAESAGECEALHAHISDITQQYNDLLEQHSTLQQYVEDIQTQYEAQQEEYNRAYQQCEELQGQITRLEDELAQARLAPQQALDATAEASAENEMLRSHIDDITQQYNDVVEHHNTLQQQFEALVANFETVQQQSTQESETNRELQTQCNALQEQIDVLNQQLTESTEQAKHSGDATAQYAAENETLRSHIDDITQQYNELVEQHNLLQQQLIDLTAEHEASQNQHDVNEAAAINEWRTKHDELQSEVQALQDRLLEREMLHSHIDTVTEQYNELVEQHNTIQQHVVDLQAQYEEAHSQLETEKNLHTELNDRYTALEQEASTLRHQASEAETLRSHLDDITAQYNELVEQHNLLQEQLEALHQQLLETEPLHAHIESITEQYNELVEQHAQIQEQNEDLRAKVDEVATLHAHVDSITEQYNELAEQHNTLQQHAEDIQTQFEQYQQQQQQSQEAQQQEARQLQEQCELFQQQLAAQQEAYNDKITEMQQEFESSQQGLHSQITDMQQELDHLTAQLQASQPELQPQSQQEACAEHTVEIDMLKGHIADISNQYNELLEQYNAMQHHIETTQAQYEEFHQQQQAIIDQLQTECAELKSKLLSAQDQFVSPPGQMTDTASTLDTDRISSSSFDFGFDQLEAPPRHQSSGSLEDETHGAQQDVVDHPLPTDTSGDVLAGAGQIPSTGISVAGTATAAENHHNSQLIERLKYEVYALSLQANTYSDMIAARNRCIQQLSQQNAFHREKCEQYEQAELQRRAEATEKRKKKQEEDEQIAKTEEEDFKRQQKSLWGRLFGVKRPMKDPLAPGSFEARIVWSDEKQQYVFPDNSDDDESDDDNNALPPPQFQPLDITEFTSSLPSKEEIFKSRTGHDYHPLGGGGLNMDSIPSLTGVMDGLILDSHKDLVQAQQHTQQPSAPDYTVKSSYVSSGIDTIDTPTPQYPPVQSSQDGPSPYSAVTGSSSMVRTKRAKAQSTVPDSIDSLAEELNMLSGNISLESDRPIRRSRRQKKEAIDHGDGNAELAAQLNQPLYSQTEGDVSSPPLPGDHEGSSIPSQPTDAVMTESKSAVAQFETGSADPTQHLMDEDVNAAQYQSLLEQYKACFEQLQSYTENYNSVLEAYNQLVPVYQEAVAHIETLQQQKLQQPDKTVSPPQDLEQVQQESNDHQQEHTEPSGQSTGDNDSSLQVYIAMVATLSQRVNELEGQWYQELLSLLKHSSEPPHEPVEQNSTQTAEDGDDDADPFSHFNFDDPEASGPLSTPPMSDTVSPSPGAADQHPSSDDSRENSLTTKLAEVSTLLLQTQSSNTQLQSEKIELEHRYAAIYDYVQQITPQYQAQSEQLMQLQDSYQQLLQQQTSLEGLSPHSSEYNQQELDELRNQLSQAVAERAQMASQLQALERTIQQLQDAGMSLRQNGALDLPLHDSSNSQPGDTSELVPSDFNVETFNALKEAIDELLHRCKEAESQLSLLHARGIDPHSLDKFTLVPIGDQQDLQFVFACSKYFLTTLAGVLASLVGVTVLSGTGF